MIRSFFDKWKDPNNPLLGPNYWLMKKTFLLFPKNQLFRILCIIYQQTGTFFTITGFIELYFDKDDVEEMLTNLKITILGVIIIAKANSIVFGQQRWRKVLGFVIESDKFERETCDEVRGEIIDTYTKYCHKVTYLYTAMICTTCVTTILTPVMAIMSSETLRNNIRNGTEPFQHILISWVPFDKYSFPGNWITVLFHIFIIIWGTGIMSANDSTVLVVMVFFAAKFDLMRERCKQMLGRDGKGISDEEATEAFGELHHIHVTLIKHMKLFNTLISPVMFTYVIVCSLMICASAYQLTMAKSLAEKLLLAEYLFFGTMQMFLFCWHSSIVVDKITKLSLGPYESQWWAASIRQRKSIIILAGQFNYVYTFSAGPFTNLTTATFLSMLKGAYSYFTLLRE